MFNSKLKARIADLESSNIKLGEDAKREREDIKVRTALTRIPKHWV